MNRYEAKVFTNSIEFPNSLSLSLAMRSYCLSTLVGPLNCIQYLTYVLAGRPRIGVHYVWWVRPDFSQCPLFFAHITWMVSVMGGR